VASIYDLKPRFQGLLRPVSATLAAAGISANQVTLAALLLSLAAGLSIAFFPTAHWPLLALPVVLFVRMALNAIDGMLAREYDMKSALGAILNEVGDVVSDAALYLPFALLPGLDARWVVLAVLLAVISEMVGVVAVQIGAGRRYDGPMGKSDRAFVFGLAALLLGLSLEVASWVNAGLIAVCVLLAMTCWNRARGALRELSA